MSIWQKLTYRYQFLNAAERLIVINVLCFVVPFVLNTLLFLFQVPSSNVFSWLHLSADWSVWITRPWTIFTYSFLHSGFFHLFWNMLLLYYAGIFFLNLFQRTTFYNVYFLGVFAGGLVFLLSYAIFPVFQGLRPPMVGASAGVMAVFVFISILLLFMVICKMCLSKKVLPNFSFKAASVSSIMSNFFSLKKASTIDLIVDSILYSYRHQKCCCFSLCFSNRFKKCCV